MRKKFNSTIDLMGFMWKVDLAGYKIIKKKPPKGQRTLLTRGLPASSGALAKPRKLIHPLGGELKLYEPRDSRGAVHRSFANCKDTEESVLEFVSKYGLLETRPEDRNKDESLEDFYSYRKNVAAVLDFVDKGELDVAVRQRWTRCASFSRFSTDAWLMIGPS